MKKLSQIGFVKIDTNGRRIGEIKEYEPILLDRDMVGLSVQEINGKRQLLVIATSNFELGVEIQSPFGYRSQTMHI